MKLGLKFASILAFLLILALSMAAWVLKSHHEKELLAEVRLRAETVLSFGEASREYIHDTVAPAVARHSKVLVLEAQSPTLAARKTFEAFRKRHPDYSFREASLNPLNPVNRADSGEERLIKTFAADPNLQEVSGYRYRDGREEFYLARPIVTLESCLKCHASAATAPKELVARYGSEHGYGWKAGDTQSAVVVTVPIADIRAAQSAMSRKMLGILGCVAITLVLAIIISFHFVVNRRLQCASNVMKLVASDPATTRRLQDTGQDEITAMAASFNRMADSLGQLHLELERKVSERTAELAAANSRLQTEVSERARAEQELVQYAQELETARDRQRQNAASLVEALKNLSEEEARTRAILETSLDCIITIDHASRIVEFNPAAEKTFGYSRQEALGKDLTDLIVPPALRDAHLAGLSNYLKTKEGSILGMRIETTAVRSDGSELPIELAVTAIQRGGQPMFTAYLRDIKQRKSAEQELQKAKEASEAANRAKSDFLANMSHEIRTPMNGILGMTELVLDTDLSPEQREYLSMIKGSADALLVVINDILDFSKIEAGRIELDPTDFSLRESLGDRIKGMALRAHMKDLELICHVRPDVPDALVGDPGRLGQVVTNLVGNAVKFTERGEIVVCVEIESLSPGRAELHFSVRDTGIGIPVDKHHAIFDPFVQADGSMTRRFGGTGLGLAISAKLVKLMGGRIWMESEVGNGSVFHFTACFKLQSNSRIARLRPRVDSLDGLRVLVVDDNATNRRILEEILFNWRMCPTSVPDAEQALQALEDAGKGDQPFALVLLDAMMPEVDGFKLAETIQQRFNQTAPTIMMLSSADRHSDAARCHDLGIARHLTKPVKQSELLNAILELLGEGPATNDAKQPEGSPHETASSTVSATVGRRILLVEDNGVNQKLASRTLEKHAHEVHIASNGREALEMIAASIFDLVLMDVQMPVMGGLEATALIRSLEKGTGRHIPIIAMTAHAMKGDRERCLEAGMDGYVSKPIQSQELLRTIEEVMTMLRPIADRPEPREHAGNVSLDRQAILARVEGDEELLQEIIVLFLEDSSRLLDDLCQAIAREDFTAIRSAAHALKGSAGNFCYAPACEAAQQIEALALATDLPGLQAAEQRLTQAIHNLQTQLPQAFPIQVST